MDSQVLEVAVLPLKMKCGFHPVTGSPSNGSFNSCRTWAVGGEWLKAGGFSTSLRPGEFRAGDNYCRWSLWPEPERPFELGQVWKINFFVGCSILKQ